MGLMIKGLLAAFWLIVVPWAAGAPFLRKKGSYTIGESFFTGYLFLFMMMEFLTLPMIYLNLPLRFLTAGYGLIAVAMTWWGLGCILKKEAEDDYMGRVKGWRPGFSWAMLAAVLMILAQLCIVVLLAHMDADDSFYVGVATTDVHTDTIFSVSPYTGNAYKKIPSRYVLSPFPVFLAVVSQLCAGLHPAIMAHTVFPAVFIAMGYLVLYQFAKKWFPEDLGLRGIFMILCAAAIWFSGYSIYNAGNFEMVRIWQGKALLAGVFLPLLAYLCMSILLSDKPEYPYGLLFMANASCCLLSSMGILLAPVLMGLFLVLCLWKYKSLRRLAAGLLCCIPSLVLGIIYIAVL